MLKTSLKNHGWTFSNGYDRAKFFAVKDAARVEVRIKNDVLQISSMSDHAELYGVLSISNQGCPSWTCMIPSHACN